ncbi:MAG: sulfite exporter TauE/SafE family protein [Lamprobacter sp.]|uniref:sulfite exporter TauE/SafE family protein n=1 Tax=Lamprobacter sp. TaxID=3100796 RepID=UPI002B26457B|nr:sulfite exporter TauE/SafE family protein [Lamprobacter sp.]MEA3640392.1 sulfite exporter TauE/SafE family protein [Lamprobacter sp.]
MSIVTAKAFRQQIMKPAEGLFLFHARAIERLIEGQLGERLAGISVPSLPYYLMPRDDFLLGLETENAEALSVIEGLRLPEQVILLPSPPNQRLQQRSFRRLRDDYWARSFEAEVARTWQSIQDCADRDAGLGASSLLERIGADAFAEVREVLSHDGLILPVWDDDLVCRSFVAFVVRLRYFAPGARGFFFPAIQDWPAVDRWMSAVGLDLPRPLVDERLPGLLLKSRPGGGGHPSWDIPLLPLALPYGRTDPDLQAVVALTQAEASAHAAAQASHPTTPMARGQRSEVKAHTAAPEPSPEQLLMEAFARGVQLDLCPDWGERLGDLVGIWRTRLLGALRWVPPVLTRWLLRRERLVTAAAGRLRREADLRAGVILFEQRVAAAVRAQRGGHLALALRRIAVARRLARRLMSDARALPAALEEAIAKREALVESLLADGLAERWALERGAGAELRALVHRLVVDDRGRYGSPAAQGLLGCLEQLLIRGPTDYYRLRLGRWLMNLGRTPISESLPFQSLLKALRALEASRARLEELPWPIAELERFTRLLRSLNQSITDRLDTELTPRLEQAMREADFIPRNHREIVAAQKMKLELLDVIKHRRHLKFTDVRDIVARNILRLPDPTWAEFFRGDRLRRFDRTAERALPGVYRPGEIYIKGLQQLGAPLFGTPLGRDILRYLLLPFGGSFLVLKSLDLLIALIPFVDQRFHFTETTSVVFSGMLINLVVHTGIGRHVAKAVILGGWRILRFLLWDGPHRLMRWWPIAALLSTGLLRGLGRNLIQPMLIGILPLAPIIALAVLVEEVPIEPGLWLLGLAFALGTLARNTPAGRRFLDNLSTRIGTSLQRLNQALFIGLIQQLLFFFKELTRRFSQLLHRVDEGLTHHRGEPLTSLATKSLLAPIWRFSEALIQFYVTVLVEPQVNPVKHFPIVTIGHKLLLPFLPAITTAFVEITQSVLPKVIAYPFVTLTIVLLPGLFGFLVWELKENWKLYEANHRQRLSAVEADQAPESPIEPAAVGAHGENMRGLMCRGFHSGTLPKSFDRLRKVIRRQLRDEAAHPKRLRRCQRHLEDLERAIGVFVDREFSFALRERCRNPDCTLTRIETNLPRLATELVEISVAIYPRARQGAGLPAHDSDAADPKPVMLGVRIAFDGREMRFDTDLSGAPERIGPHCWDMISEDLRLFMGRAGADLNGLDLSLPTAAKPVSGAERFGAGTVRMQSARQ